MEAIVIKPNLDFDIVKLQKENILKQLQEIVGGLIEVPYLGEVFSGFNIVTVINEEGKLINDFKPSMALEDEKGRIIDLVYGPVVLLSQDDEGNFKGLDTSQITLFLRTLLVANNYGAVNRETNEKCVFFGFPFKLNIESIINNLFDEN